MTSSTVAGSVATIASLTDEAHYYYEQTLLDRAIGYYFYCPFAKTADIPANKGTLIQWDKYSAFSAATTPIGGEGVEPASEGLSMTTITAEPLQYGSFVRYTDKLELQAFHPVTRNISRLLGEQAGLTADTLARELMTASGTAQIADSTVNRETIPATAILDANEIARAYATLLNYNARGWDFIEGRYAVITSPLAWYDLINDAAFRNAGQEALPRSEQHPFWTGEVWDYMRCRFFLTSNAKYVADGGLSSVDAYLTMVIGRDAFGIAGMGGYGFRPDLGAGGTGNEVSPVQLIMKPLDSGGADNPMNLRGSIAWKGYQQERELDSTWAVRIEHACTLGSN